MDDVERVARAICATRGMDADRWRVFEHRALEIIAELHAARSPKPRGGSVRASAGS